jgi:hypothetical protein
MEQINTPPVKAGIDFYAKRYAVLGSVQRDTTDHVGKTTKYRMLDLLSTKFVINGSQDSVIIDNMNTLCKSTGIILPGWQGKMKSNCLVVEIDTQKSVCHTRRRKNEFLSSTAVLAKENYAGKERQDACDRYVQQSLLQSRTRGGSSSGQYGLEGALG